MGIADDAWVYILRCADESLYAGWCTDPARRLREHRAGRASKYTASRLPVEIAFLRELPDRARARREEARIKSLSRREKLTLIEDHSRDARRGGRIDRALAPS